MNTRISLIGVPQDLNSFYLRGPAKAPFAMVEALHCDSANLWTETGLDLSGVLGHQGALDLGDAETTFSLIETTAEQAGGTANGFW